MKNDIISRKIEELVDFLWKGGFSRDKYIEIIDGYVRDTIIICSDQAVTRYRETIEQANKRLRNKRVQEAETCREQLQDYLYSQSLLRHMDKTTSHL